MSGQTAWPSVPPCQAVGVSTPVTRADRQSARCAPRAARTSSRTARSYSAVRSRRHAVDALLLAAATRRRATVTFDAGKNKAPNLKEGKARIVVETVSNDLRGAHGRPRRPTSKWCSRRRAWSRTTPSTTSTRAAWNWSTFTPGGSWTEAGREGRQVHLPQFPAARPIPTSASPCSPTPGTCRPDVTPAGLRAQPRGHRSHRARSGSSSSPRSSAPAISRSTTR